MMDHQGIHNVFIVIPQLIIAGLSSIIFAIFEPGKSVLQDGNVIPPVNGTSVSIARDSSHNATGALLWRQEADAFVPKVEGVNSVAIVFR
jgi:solute carrier family 45 protein 1/2/4